MQDPPNGSAVDLPRRLSRWRQLVTTEWLAAWLAGRPVVAAPTGHWRLIEVGCGDSALHAAAHIPTAGYLDTRNLEDGPCWKRRSDAELLRALMHQGITHDTTVLLYGRNMLAAGRAAHLMLYLGVADVRLLDGGFDGWLAAGHSVAQGMPPAVAPSAFGCPIPRRPEYLADSRHVRDTLRRADGKLVSIRTWNEYIGETSGYAYIEARGDIPGARWGHAGRSGDVNSMSDFHHADGTLKDPDDIEAFWREAGVHAGDQATFYCGTAWRASLAFFYAWLMGWQRIAVYDGGWCDWSADAANPIVHGHGEDVTSGSGLHELSAEPEYRPSQ